MKPYTYAFLAAAAACGMAHAETAYTTPVGYMTVPIPGTGGVGTSKLQLANQGLLPAGPAVAGGGASVTFSGSTMTDTNGAWAAGDFVNGGNVSHVLEITSDGAVKGALSWITATDVEEITTADDLSAAGAGASYRVWAAYTVSSLFGDPPTDTVLGGSSDAGAADGVQIYDPTTNVYTNFWYKNSGKGGTGWQSSDPGITNPASYAIHPNDGMVILRKQSGDGELVISGSVKTGPTKVRVEGVATPGVTTLNILANQIPVEQLTPENSGLYTGSSATGLNGSSDAGSADSLLIFNAVTNAYTTFWYKDSGKGGTGWQSSDPGILDPANYVLPSDASLLIQRKGNGPFSWTVPTVNVSE